MQLPHTDECVHLLLEEGYCVREVQRLARRAARVYAPVKLSLEEFAWPLPTRRSNSWSDLPRFVLARPVECAPRVQETASTRHDRPNRGLSLRVCRPASPVPGAEHRSGGAPNLCEVVVLPASGATRHSTTTRSRLSRDTAQHWLTRGYHKPSTQTRSDFACWPWLNVPLGLQ